ncbi:MAG TPA: hypothetical protein DCQ93_05260 [Bacteroidetes bacterium]|nr:hypothetical protein [Bacteroidota bacterium]
MNKFSILRSTALLVLLSIVSVFAYAKTESVPPVGNSTTVQFTISIPDEVSSSISRVDAENEVDFYFKKQDGSDVFLFSVNRVSENLWVNIKDQVGSYQLLDHRGGYIYFVSKTDKSKLKGEDSEKYSAVFSQMDVLIKSIKITE